MRYYDKFGIRLATLLSKKPTHITSVRRELRIGSQFKVISLQVYTANCKV